jgi:hypothetical protein
MRLGFGLGLGGQKYVPSFDQILADGNTLGRWRYNEFEDVPQRLSFVSTNEASVYLGADTLSFANGQSDFSIIAYLKDNGSVDDTNASLIEFADNLLIRIRFSSTDGLLFLIYDGAYHTITSSPAATSGWCMIVCTLEVATKRMTYWVNGQYIGENFLSNLNFIIDRGNAFNKNSYGPIYSDCEIGKVAICNYVLSSTQIQSLTPANIINTSPIHFWDFHEGSGAALEDIVGDVDGTIQNATWEAREFGQLTDLSGNGAHMIAPATVSPPTLSPDSVSFNGVDNALTTGDIGLAHPVTVYLVVKQNMWVSVNTIISAWASGFGVGLRIMQYISDPQLTISYEDYSFLDENVIGAKQCLITYRAASDGWLMLNNNYDTKTGPGTLNPTTLNGIVLGGAPSALPNYSLFSNIEFYEMIIRQGEDSVNDIAAIYQYLKYKYSIT